VWILDAEVVVWILAYCVEVSFLYIIFVLWCLKMVIFWINSNSCVDFRCWGCCVDFSMLRWGIFFICYFCIIRNFLLIFIYYPYIVRNFFVFLFFFFWLAFFFSSLNFFLKTCLECRLAFFCCVDLDEF